MSATATPTFKPLLSMAMAESCLLSFPSFLSAKPRQLCLSIPTRPTTKLHLSYSHLCLKPSTHFPCIVPYVAQTSDWAQQEEDNDSTITIPESEMEQEEEEDPTWETEDTGASASDWGPPEEEDAAVEAIGGEGGSGDVESWEEEDPEPQPPPEDAKVFVGNLPYDVDSQNLAELFEKAGTVEIAEVIYNRETDTSRGFGFVTMSAVEEAEKAVEMFHRYAVALWYKKQVEREQMALYVGSADSEIHYLDDGDTFLIAPPDGMLKRLGQFLSVFKQDLDGRFLTVNKAAPRGSRPPERPRPVFETGYRIYVGNLPWDVDNGHLEQIFSEHGKVVNARVVYDRDTGRSRGFGFVTMSTEPEMNDAIAALDGQNVDGRAIRVNAAEGRPRRSF